MITCHVSKRYTCKIWSIQGNDSSSSGLWCHVLLW